MVVGVDLRSGLGAPSRRRECTRATILAHWRTVILIGGYLFQELDLEPEDLDMLEGGMDMDALYDKNLNACA